MSKGNAQKRQKKLEKAKKKRALVRQKNQQKAMESSPAGMMLRAREAPFGPAWVSEAIDDGADPPQLVSAIITRSVRSMLLPEVLLIDRTCLGIKNAFMLRPMGDTELHDVVATMNDRGDPLRRCEPLVVQSLAFHALDYARSLGFEPHRDFRRVLLEPRPDTLLAPTLSISRPYFISGPNDDVAKILKQLERSVGAGNYDFLAVPMGSDLDDWSDEGWDDEDEWEDADSDADLETGDRTDVVETTGVLVGDAEL